jgi:hypothetical protein
MAGAGGSGASDGNRFSKATMSYVGSGISVGKPPGLVGHKGQKSGGGRKVRSCRWVAVATHSPKRGCQRSSDIAGRASATLLDLLVILGFRRFERVINYVPAAVFHLFPALYHALAALPFLLALLHLVPLQLNVCFAN